MRKLATIVAVAGTLLAGCGGGSGYSDAFKESFMSSCESTSGGQTEYCQCALDHLEANGPENEGDITAADQQAAIDACISEVTGS